MKKNFLKCINCKNKIESKNKYFPFCSIRCSKIDLYKWFETRYVISKDLNLDN